MNVKCGTVLESLRALQSFDGNERERFKFAPSTMLAIARNIRRLKDAADDIERTRQQLIRDQGLGKIDEKGIRIPDAPERLTAFHHAFQIVLDADVDLAVNILKAKDLRLEINNIPVTVLAALNWMFEDDPSGSVHG